MSVWIEKFVKALSDDPSKTYYFRELSLYVVASNGTLSFFTTRSSLIARYFAHTGERKNLIFNRLRQLLLAPSEPTEQADPPDESYHITKKTMNVGDVSFNVTVYEGITLRDLEAKQFSSFVNVGPDDVTEWIISMTATHKLYLLCEMFDAYTRQTTYMPISAFADEWFKINKAAASSHVKEGDFNPSTDDGSVPLPIDPLTKLVRDSLNTEYKRFIYTYLMTFGSDPSNSFRIAEAASELLDDLIEENTEDAETASESADEEEYVTVRVSKKKLEELKNFLN